MEKEIWKDIEGYEGRYQVSNLGRVKSLKREIYDTVRKYTRTTEEKILKLNLSTPKYYSVQLTKEGIQKTFRVHILVARAFLSNPQELPVVNHKNGIKTDNRVKNLEWCTYKHNSQEALRLGLTKSSIQNLKRWNGCFGYKHNRSKAVKQIDIVTKEIISIYGSCKEAERKTGINASNIGNCCNHKSFKDKNGQMYETKTAGGYKWEFV